MRDRSTLRRHLQLWDTRTGRTRVSPAPGYFEIVPNRKLVFTDALAPGFRPKEAPFFTATILMEPEGSGTRYTAVAMHADPGNKKKHEEMGFFGGCGALCSTGSSRSRKVSLWERGRRNKKSKEGADWADPFLG